jgi:hypothetical protein
VPVELSDSEDDDDGVESLVVSVVLVPLEEDVDAASSVLAVESDREVFLDLERSFFF